MDKFWKDFENLLGTFEDDIVSKISSKYQAFKVEEGTPLTEKEVTVEETRPDGTKVTTKTIERTYGKKG